MGTRVTRREMLRWSLVSSGAITLAACAPQPPTAAPTQAPKVAPTQAATIVPAKQATPAPKQPVEVQVWVQEAFGQAVWDAVDKAFHAAQDQVKVKRLTLPYGDMEAKVLTAFAANEPLDVIYVDPMRNNTYAVKGAIIPLDDYLPDLPFPESDWYPVIGYCRWRGHTWSLPYQDNPNQLGYNPDLVQAAGLTQPRELWQKGQWTKEKYDEYVIKLTKGEGANKVFGTAITGQGSVRNFPCMWIWGYGGGVFNAEETHTLIAEPAALAGWTDLAKYLDKGWAPTPGDLTGISAAARWEKCAIGSTTRWDLANWVRTDKWPSLRMVPWFIWPVSKKTKVRNFNNAHGIFSRSKNKDACWTFIKWLTTEGHKMLVDLGICTPLRKSLMADKAWEKSLHLPVEDAEVYKFSAESVRFLSHVVNMSEIDKLIVAAYESILLKQKTPQQAMSAIVPAIDQILDEGSKMTLPKLS